MRADHIEEIPRVRAVSARHRSTTTNAGKRESDDDAGYADDRSVAGG